MFNLCGCHRKCKQWIQLKIVSYFRGKYRYQHKNKKINWQSESLSNPRKLKVPVIFWTYYCVVCIIILLRSLISFITLSSALWAKGSQSHSTKLSGWISHTFHDSLQRTDLWNRQTLFSLFTFIIQKINNNNVKQEIQTKVVTFVCAATDGWMEAKLTHTNSCTDSLCYCICSFVYIT